ncbi:sporulation protein Cse60 [Streptococcus salivarius]|uniref:sporulation protein Cse60 n=1 Tax=Streptococcus salivarius TaxID=1304 RepID=UPI0039C44530
MVIKTREFSTETGDKVNIAMLINLFLSSGYVDELIDIKYQTVAIDLGGATIIQTSALVIYKGESND